MKFKILNTEEREKYWDDWKPWFAWYPIRVNSFQVIWLETVEKKWKHFYIYDVKFRNNFEYREKQS